MIIKITFQDHVVPKDLKNYGVKQCLLSHSMKYFDINQVCTIITAAYFLQEVKGGKSFEKARQCIFFWFIF